MSGDKHAEASHSGFEAAPPHYAGEGSELEAIDQIWATFREIANVDGYTHLAHSAERHMVAFCLGNEMKYSLRAGRKTAGDAEKARWYSMFASYVLGDGPDPRTERPGWTPHPDAPRPSGGRS